MAATGQVWKLTSLNSLHLMGNTQLQEEDLTPRQKERVLEVFSRALNHPAVSRILQRLNSRVASIDFNIDEKGFSINGTSAVPFSEFTRWRSPFKALYQEIKALDRFAKREGKGTRTTVHRSGTDQTIQRVATQAIRERADDPPFERPGFQEKHAIYIDLVSYTRNMLTLTAGKVATVLGLACAGGAAGFIQGGLIARGAVKDALRFYRHGDGEGMAHSLQLLGIGATYSSVSTGMAINASATFANNAAMAATGLTLLTFSGFALQTILGIYALHGWRMTRNFRLELKEILDEAKEPNETKRLLAALSWIEEQVGLSEWDIMEIRSQSKNPQEAESRIKKRLQKKWSQFERRTNVECGEYLRSKLAAFAEISKGLENGDAAAIGEARKIVEEVEKANYKERVRYKCLFLIAIIGTLGFVMAFFCPFLVPILFALGALLWLTVDSKGVRETIGAATWNTYVEKREAARLALKAGASERSSAA